MKKITERLIVYLQLMRADKPIGTLLLLWPTLWGLWIAAQGHPEPTLLIVFGIGTFLMRSAGCVANDYFDRDIDGAVARTRNRPFARGAVSGKEAWALVGVLCVGALLCLIPLNATARWLSLPALFLALSYPLTKRFFPIPQLYLGLAFSFGIPMAFAAQSGHIPPVAWLLYAANIAWTVAYDTMYAIADKPDDLKLGIKTSAITFGEYDVAFTMGFHALFDLLMVVVGCMIGAHLPYWLALVLVGYLQWRQYGRIQSRDREACFQEFLGNNVIGWVWWSALCVNFLWA